MKTDKNNPTTFLTGWTRFFGAMLVVTLMISAAAFSQTTVDLGTAANFGVLASAAITGTSAVTGNVGTTDALATIASTITAEGGYTKYDPTVPADQAIVNAAHDDLVLAYNDAATRVVTTVLSAAAYDFTGANLTPGVYSVGTSAAMTTSMTLNGAGIYIFQIGTTLGTTAGVTVNLTGGAVWSDVFWQVGAAVSIAGSTIFEGTILAHDAITVGAAATVSGRLLAGAVVAGAVTDNASTVILPVELVSLTATANRISAELRWSTATEVNNHGFEIERRQAAQWQKVGFVTGAGTSNSPHAYSYSDNNLSPGRYAYRLKQVDNDGAFSYYGLVEVNIGEAPQKFALSQNHPNPFNPSTKIQYSLENAGMVSLKVYDLLGQEVATLVNGNQEAGSYTVPFSTNMGTVNLSSGVFFYRLEAGSFVSTKKLILMK